MKMKNFELTDLVLCSYRTKASTDNCSLRNVGIFLQVDILKRRRKMKLASCFDLDKGQHGWCATCLPNAANGTRGYCGEGETGKAHEAPIITANSVNWGFCTHECTRMSQETKNMLMVGFPRIPKLPKQTKVNPK